jgi:hypothetical protein
MATTGYLVYGWPLLSPAFYGPQDIGDMKVECMDGMVATGVLMWGSMEVSITDLDMVAQDFMAANGPVVTFGTILPYAVSILEWYTILM